MQPILKTTFLLLTILQHLPFILGTACTQSNALPYTKGGGDGCSASDIASDDTGCVKQYCTTGGTATSLKVCFCQAANERNCGSITEKRDEMEDSQQKRQSFNCSKDETCYTNPVDGRLFCLNKSTGNYIGELGDSGNVNTGAYTPPSGGTSAATAAATTSGGSDSTSVGFSSVSTKAAKSTGMSADLSSATTTTTSTSATGVSTKSLTAGLAKVTAGAFLGALGLAVGFVL